MKSEFATRLAGSADLYHTNKRKPYHSINFVIAHDGFTLADLVAYNEKHNDFNGEGNRERGTGSAGSLLSLCTEMLRPARAAEERR